MRPYQSAGLLETALLVLLAACQQCVRSCSDTSHPPPPPASDGTLYAACILKPNALLPEGSPKVFGHVLFKQDNPQGKLTILLDIKSILTDGLPGERHVDVHEYGDLSQGCESTGGRYNPYSENYPKGVFGDSGFHSARIQELIELEKSDIRLLFGKAVVVHAGQKLACCVIGCSSSNVWDVKKKQYDMRPCRHMSKKNRKHCF